jgi:hypothetical protein
MKLDVRNYDVYVDENENGNMSFSNKVKNKKKHVPNDFKKNDNKKYNKPKRIQRTWDD